MIQKYIQLFFLLIFLGCTTTEYNEVVLVEIDSEFLVHLDEELHADEPELYLSMVSKESVFCEDASIDYEISTKNRHIALYVLGVSKPLDCGTKQWEYIEEKIHLDVGELGEYSLVINFSNYFQNIGRLLVLPDRYELYIEADKGLELRFKTLYRTPKNLLWGQMTGLESNRVEQLLADFIQSIDPIVEQVRLSVGQYASFSIQDNESMMLNTPSPGTNGILFYRSLTGKFTSLEKALADFRTQLPEAYSIKLFTGTGEEL